MSDKSVLSTGMWEHLNKKELLSEISRLQGENIWLAKIINTQVETRNLFADSHEVMVDGLRHIVVSLRDQLRTAEQLAEKLATDALKSLAGIVCTPIEGYLKAPQCLSTDIGSLVKKFRTAEQENERLQKIANKYHWNRQQDWAGDVAKFYKQRYKETQAELRTSEQRVAGEILEIVERNRLSKHTISTIISAIKTKYHLGD